MPGQGKFGTCEECGTREACCTIKDGGQRCRICLDKLMEGKNNDCDEQTASSS